MFFGWMLYPSIMLIIMLAVLGIAIVASIVQSNFKQKNHKYAQIANSSEKTGAQIANEILERWSITNVHVVMGQEGKDHYNPRTNQVVLSPSVYNSSSVSAAAIAAHEVGHVIQWAKQEKKIKVRDNLIQPVQVASKIGNTLMFMSFFILIFSFGASGIAFGWMAFAGFLIYGTTGLFQLATLPVEFNASRKAMTELKALNILTTDEDIKGAKSVLNSAAMTYVFAFLSSVIMFTIILLMLLARSRR